MAFVFKRYVGGCVWEELPCSVSFFEVSDFRIVSWKEIGYEKIIMKGLLRYCPTIKMGMEVKNRG